MFKKTMTNLKTFISTVDFSPFIFSVSILLAVLLLAKFVKWLEPGVFNSTTWELILDSEIAVVLSLFNTVQIFWWLDTFKGARRLVLPGKDEAEAAETYLSVQHTRNAYAGYLFLGLSMRDSARVVAMSIIFMIHLYMLAPIP